MQKIDEIKSTKIHNGIGNIWEKQIKIYFIGWIQKRQKNRQRQRERKKGKTNNFVIKSIEWT